LLTSCVGESKVFDGDGTGAAVVLLLTFFVSYLCQLYFVSLMFVTPANAVRFVLFFQLFLGFIPVRRPQPRALSTQTPNFFTGGGCAVAIIPVLAMDKMMKSTDTDGGPLFCCDTANRHTNRSTHWVRH
jgi:hypothetical protein